MRYKKFHLLLLINNQSFKLDLQRNEKNFGKNINPKYLKVLFSLIITFQIFINPFLNKILITQTEEQEIHSYYPQQIIITESTLSNIKQASKQKKNIQTN
ncbi:hypothetical protein ABPG74_014721 [Tetrahymena malaccensis]